jgi:uncharacterized protein (TIGR02678 family)
VDDSDPQARFDLVDCARYLLQHPLLCREHDPWRFRLVRRYEHDLDRWFTQRLGYRLHLGTDTARLFKSTVVATRRPLVTASKSKPRPLAKHEYVLLCLILAAVASGPRVISLRDLIDRLRTAATDAGVELDEEPTGRRALITAIHWMIGNGLVSELHERVDRYVVDEQADAVLEVVPDRVALVPLRSLSAAETAEGLLERPERITASRQWMRARIVEDGVLYRDDLEPAEWGELRRRLGEEADLLGAMFGLHLEARAEGVAAIDPEGRLSDHQLPATGTESHAALLLLDRLGAEHDGGGDGGGGGDPRFSNEQVVAALGELSAENRHWSKLADNPAKLAKAVLSLLADHRLVDLEGDAVRLRPLARRFAVAVAVEAVTPGEPCAPAAGQGQLW